MYFLSKWYTCDVSHTKVQISTNKPNVFQHLIETVLDATARQPRWVAARANMTANYYCVLLIHMTSIVRHDCPTFENDTRE